jgi:hypothetical protein
MTTPSSETIRVPSAAEPWGAWLIGGVLGASTFLLCALLFGGKTAIAIAVVAMIVALARRIPGAATAFAAAAALSAAWLISSTLALVAASTVFGLALVLYARARARTAHGD